MSELAKKTAELVDLLPFDEQELAFEFMKRMVLAWDPDFTKLTQDEKERVEKAEREMEQGEFVFDKDISWEN